MITYDYFIKRDEKKEVKEFRPKKIPKSLPNLVYVEGPNSSGKSTLLHLLALGLHGLSGDHTIRPVLKEKMKNLIASEHQSLSFDIEITDKNDGVVLSSKKNSLDKKEILLRDGKNKIITAEEFSRRYKLIYDIPENPTERLKDLTREIKDTQSQLGKRVGFFRGYLDKIIYSIREAKNPELIDKTREELQGVEKSFAKSQLKIESLEKQLDVTRVYVAVKYCIVYKEKVQDFTEQLNLIKRDNRKRAKGRTKVTEEYAELHKELSQKIQEIQDAQFKAMPVLKSLFEKKEKNRLQVWQDIDIEKEINQHQLRSALKRETMHFILLLKRLLDSYSETKNHKKAAVYNDLIGILEKYKNLEIKIPGVASTIPNFIKLLRKEAKKYDDDLERGRNVSDTIESLKAILEAHELAVKDIVPKLKLISEKKTTGETLVEHDEIEIKFEQLNNKKNEAEDAMNYYKMECAKLDIKEKEIYAYYKKRLPGPTYSHLKSYRECDLREKTLSLNKAILDEKVEFDNKKEFIAYLKVELERLENRQPHQYQEHLLIFQKLLKVAEKLEQKMLVEFDESIKELINKSVDKSKLSKEKQKYFDFVFKFLANRIGFLRHIDEEHSLEKVDLIDGNILTSEGRVLQIADLGTGQSQSAYLTGLLTATDTNRKIIALFDEVAMMDSKSLEPVYKKLRELYENDKLLIGVIVQKAEELHIVDKTC